jgi:hypothetical protein
VSLNRPSICILGRDLLIDAIPQLPKEQDLKFSFLPQHFISYGRMFKAMMYNCPNHFDPYSMSCSAMSHEHTAQRMVAIAHDKTRLSVRYGRTLSHAEILIPVVFVHGSTPQVSLIMTHICRPYHGCRGCSYDGIASWKGTAC